MFDQAQENIHLDPVRSEVRLDRLEAAPLGRDAALECANDEVRSAGRSPSWLSRRAERSRMRSLGANGGWRLSTW